MAKASTFQVTVRWAAWNMFNNYNMTDNTINLIGGPSPIPDRCFVFHQTGEGIGSSASLTNANIGTISFQFTQQKRVSKKFNLNPI